MLNDFLCSRPAIDVPVDAGDATAKALRIDSRSDLVMIVGLALGLIVLLAGEVKDRWIGGIIGIDPDMLTELDIVMVAAAVIALEVVVTVSCVGDARAVTAIGRNVTIIARVDVLVGLLIDLRTDPIIGFVPGVGVDVLAAVDANLVAAAMTALKCIGTRVSLEDSLRFRC